MATVLRPPYFRALPDICLKPTCISLIRRGTNPSCSSSLRSSDRKPLRLVRLVSFAEPGAAETQEEEAAQPPEFMDAADGGEDGAREDNKVVNVEEMPMSPIVASLKSYKEAVATKDASRMAEVEVLLKSIEDEKMNLEQKVATLTEELSVERVRVLRTGADFEIFRKRTDGERHSLVTNAQSELVENLLLILDNFERVKKQIKAGTEAEEKIINSYHGIYKQFMEILNSRGVAVPIEPKGRFSRVRDGFNGVVNRVGSGFKKTLARFRSKSLE